jgi:imidazolonepropionase-like amidohydrolase
MIKPLHQSGVNIIAGSDCGAFNSYIYPGESLLKELITLVNVGLSNRETLASSIINGPEFFGLRDYYGSIGPRKVANLLILTENPLENIKNITSLETVIRGDKIYNQDKIRGLLTSIKRN